MNFFNGKFNYVTKKRCICILFILSFVLTTSLTACKKTSNNSKASDVASTNGNNIEDTQDEVEQDDASSTNDKVQESKSTSLIAYNPYSVNNGHWYKGCTHFHIDDGDGSDDGKNTLDEMAAAFKKNNFDFAFSTSHGCCNAKNEKVNGVMIYKGEEAVTERSEVNIFGLTKSFHDSYDDTVPDVLKKFKDSKTLIQLNHPNREKNLKATTSDILEYCKNGLWGIEMLNGGSYLEKTELWDCALKNGTHLWATFGADAHKVENVTRGWIVVNSKQNSLESIMDSMKNGNFYCSTGEVINSININNNTVSLDLKDPTCKVVWYDLNEAKLGEGLKYTITGKEHYVRAIVTNKDNKKSFAWTQPIFINKGTNNTANNTNKNNNNNTSKNTNNNTANVKGLTPSQLSVAEKLISVFENGTTEIQYGYSENIHDGRGITSGRAGFCTGTGDAYEVIKNYTKEVPNNVLAKYLTELKRLDDYGKKTDETSGLEKIGDFSKDWKEACKDQKFKDAQDKIFYEWYYEPSCEEADKLGAKLPLTRAVLFDTAIQHGTGSSSDDLGGIIASTNKEAGGTPKEINEKDWLKKYLEVRGKLLSTKEWQETQYRTEIFTEIYNDGNFDLSKPITIKHKDFKGITIKP